MKSAVPNMGKTLGPKEDLPEKKEYTDSSSDESEPAAMPVPVAPTKTVGASGNESVVETKKTVESLQERGKIPSSFFVTVLIIILNQASSGIYSIESLQNCWSSVTTSLQMMNNVLEYTKDLMTSVYEGNLRGTKEYLIAAGVTAVVASWICVFVWVPFRAGVWTHRAIRHKVHRYMGLLFIIQYALAVVEFMTDYKNDGTLSLLTNSLAINGIVQAYSAYFSFRVLPKGEDAGYYSDKGVLTRDFVHENVYFQLLCFMASTYYDSGRRECMRSNLPGKLAELLYVFFPYVLIRPFFPLTSFSKSTSRQKNSRSSDLERFYQIGTRMVKIFYLWAKYFLGFHIQYMIYLDLIEPQNMKIVHGVFLLNLGTCSLGVFLHTLRFKKILPPLFTFSLYLFLIYATFSAVPYVLNLFVMHPKLCLVTLAGFLLNFTRNRKIHAVWCFGSMLLLEYGDIDW
ncbi:expressed unknown protein [Seminavis robusta]|uniref:O-acyltransferase n=1 Tax=Seminavis robusta TaxID=568900 RepID=A0A9N8DNZ8_9STRA|nr:expressed unknown protein [Seminavis robusta]|eukprot:Sro185_g080380.1 n/a (456) ;mRNA; r:58669-60210